MSAQLELAQKPFIELQIEALVEENRIKPKQVNKFIDELEARIIAIKDLNLDKLLSRIFRLPIVGRPNALDADYPKGFKFRPPTGLHVIGGFRTSTAIKKKTFVDLAVCLPVECIEKKDIKNQRYHHKRALYLAQLAFLLNGPTCSDLIDNLEFSYYQGDFLKPVLIITPKEPKLKTKTAFQLFVHCSPECSIKQSLLRPVHGNVAPNWFFKDYTFDINESDIAQFFAGDSDIAPSPFYNSTILMDMEMLSNSNILAEQIGAHASLSEALMLSKIWLHQRELHNHFSFIISMFIAYLQTHQNVHQNMSAYQIFKIIIKSVASSDWSEAGLSYYDDSKDKISIYKENFPVVFLSPSGNLNLCYNITDDLYYRLKHEALLSQNILNANKADTFELLFLKKLDFVTKFDVIVHIPKCTRKLPVKLDYLRKFMDHGVFTPRVYSESILHLARKALTDRVILIQQSSNHLLIGKKWNLKSSCYDPSNEDHTFSLGLLLEPEKSLRIIDIGPQADTPGAEEFRQFWEPKCQLRLQNGIISETVVWHINNFSQRRAIIKYILTHALKRIDIHDVVVHYTLLERFISLQNVFFRWRDEADETVVVPAENGQGQKRKHAEIKNPIGVGEEIFQKVLHSYNELNKIIRNLDNLKYLITSIQPMSHHLRGSSIYPPLPVSLQTRNKNLKRRRGVTLFPQDFNQVGKVLHIEQVDILLTLESSGKWPRDLEAFEAAKLDYLIKLGEALKEKGYSVKFSDSYLDVLYGQFVFRLRVKCQKDLALTASMEGKQEFQRKRLELEILPRVHAALDQLYRERTAFGLTCRLAKRWLSCQLMGDHLSDVAVDLIVAHLFLHSEPYTEPASSFCGFRRFLMLMAHHDWKQLPLVVNFDGQLKMDEVIKLHDSMSEDRSKFPPMAICTPFDKDLSPWTRSDLSQTKLEMMTRICNKALEFFDKNIMNNFDTNHECKALFRPNFKLYDLLIKLHPQVVQNFFMSIDAPKDFRLEGREPSGKQVSAFSVMPITGLNLVEQYVKTLQKEHSQVASFFYDKFGQKIIGVVLKHKTEDVVDNLIENVKKLGSKLVESVTVVRNK